MRRRRIKRALAELYPDPFCERTPARFSRELRVLGARVNFESDSAELLRLVDAAYGGLPRHTLPTGAPRLRVRLVLTTRQTKTGAEPAPLQMMSATGLLAGTTETSGFVVVSVRERSALVVLSPRMLKFPYHSRYELIEFAVFTLAARAQGLISLHGACLGRRGRGVLLMGPSGSGKSTLTLQCLMEGWQILSEDSVFVTADALLATGVSNFLHVRVDSLPNVTADRTLARIRKAPVIRRRTGVRKYEFDLREGDGLLAHRPLKIQAILFLSSRSAGGKALLTPLSYRRALPMLVHEQAYAANQSSWRSFTRNLKHIRFFELKRGRNPGESAAALRDLMA